MLNSYHRFYFNSNVDIILIFQLKVLLKNRIAIRSLNVFVNQHK